MIYIIVTLIILEVILVVVVIKKLLELMKQIDKDAKYWDDKYNHRK